MQKQVQHTDDPCKPGSKNRNRRRPRDLERSCQSHQVVAGRWIFGRYRIMREGGEEREKECGVNIVKHDVSALSSSTKHSRRVSDPRCAPERARAGACTKAVRLCLVTPLTLFLSPTSGNNTLPSNRLAESDRQRHKRVENLNQVSLHTHTRTTHPLTPTHEGILRPLLSAGIREYVQPKQKKKD